MSVESLRSLPVRSRTAAGWVLAGAALYLPLVYAATTLGVAPIQAGLQLALPVVALFWGGRDLLRATRLGPALLMSGLLLLIAGSFEISGLLTGWPSGEQPVADLFLLAGIFGSVWIEARRPAD
jgi:hypothetical protein